MKAPFGKCSIEFSVNSKKNGYVVPWVEEIMRHTLVDEIVCIQSATLTEDGTSKDMMSAILQFCNSNPGSIIMLMCGQRKSSEAGAAEGRDEAQDMLNLAKQKVVYSVLGFNDISHWIDYDGTCVFLYGNDSSYEFMERLTAFQAASYLSTLREMGSATDIIANELRDSEKSCAVLQSVLDQLREGEDDNEMKTMTAF